MKAAVDPAHDHGVKMTGHLCSIGFREAAGIGIDNLEHGLVVDTEFYSGKQPGECPPSDSAGSNQGESGCSGPRSARDDRDLVAHHVAITSTLAIL